MNGISFKDLSECDEYIDYCQLKDRLNRSYFSLFIYRHGFNEDMVKPFVDSLSVTFEEARDYCGKFWNISFHEYMKTIDDMSKVDFYGVHTDIFNHAVESFILTYLELHKANYKSNGFRVEMVKINNE